MKSLKELRISTGLSQDNMARKVGVSLSMYEKVERGNIQASRNFMEKIKNHFPYISIDNVFFSAMVKKNATNSSSILKNG